MKIRIGAGLVLGGSIYQLKSGIQGLDSPDIRIGDGLYAGRDGGFVSGHFYGHRKIILPGFYVGNSCEETDRYRRELSQSLRIRYALPIFIETFSGKHYFTEGYVSNFKSELTSPKVGEFQITLICPDPIFYEMTDGVSVDEIWTEDSLTVGSKTGIVNGGGVSDLPIITLTGALTNPVITNETVLKKMDVTTTLTAGQELVINMKNRMITLDGSAINIDRSLDSEWWELLTGTNEVSVSVGSGTPSVSIKHRKGFSGI